jgi:2-polyprenyl-3-methyl-5-hydroxy-6-metoxy-1,4-benzoquinol methylase
MVAVRRRQFSRIWFGKNAIIIASLAAVSFLLLGKNCSIDLQNVNTLSTATVTETAFDPSSWTWFNGDLNDYYNELVESDSKRNPNEIKTYAVHRWLGKKYSTLVHYELINSIIRQFIDQADSRNLKVLDAGCGLGAGLMWFEKSAPKFSMVGHTISTAQIDFINKLPSHKFNAVLKSYDDLDVYKKGNEPFDVIYSIEAFVHSPDERNTLKNWAEALADEGIVVLIDDFLSVGVDKQDNDVHLYAKSWMSNVLQTTTSLTEMAESLSLRLILDRDIGSEYQVIKRNYQNKIPDIRPTDTKHHQGWLGSGMRQKLTVEGKLTYRMVVFQKEGGMQSTSRVTQQDASKVQTYDHGKSCASVNPRLESDLPLKFETIKAEHRTGEGNDGGEKQQCISGWYCCGKGDEWWDNLEANKTHHTEYLKLPKHLFGGYMEKCVFHLNAFYRQLPVGISGKFLDIGGTGSVASGMKKVTGKFAHLSGPFDYWVLDSDSAAKGMDNALNCDIDDCPTAEDCEFDVTFSHTVLEHSPHPWAAFDTVARITKKGGLTIHVVPFSYQYHATPDDNYRFSHKALTSLLEDRGFKILEVGYDICTKPEKVLKNYIDEHFDVIWISYVVGQKL